MTMYQPYKRPMDLRPGDIVDFAPALDTMFYLGLIGTAEDCEWMEFARHEYWIVADPAAERDPIMDDLVIVHFENCPSFGIPDNMDIPVADNQNDLDAAA